MDKNVESFCCFDSILIKISDNCNLTSCSCINDTVPSTCQKCTKPCFEAYWLISYLINGNYSSYLNNTHIISKIRKDAYKKAEDKLKKDLSVDIGTCLDCYYPKNNKTHIIFACWPFNGVNIFLLLIMILFFLMFCYATPGEIQKIEIEFDTFETSN